MREREGDRTWMDEHLQEATIKILYRLVKLSKEDIRKYKRILKKNPKWLRHDRSQHIKHEAVDAVLFLEAMEERFGLDKSLKV